MRKALFLLLPLTVTSAHAVYVDVRHEYLDDSKANYDRAYISHRFANGFGFAIEAGNDSNLLIVFYVQIMPDDFVMQLHRF